MNPTIVSPICKIKYTFHNKVTFVKLQYKNTWIYWVNQPYIITIICSEQTYKHELISTGLISINSNCKISIKNQILYPYNTNTKTSNIKIDLFTNTTIHNTHSIISKLSKISTYNLTLPHWKLRR